MTEDGRYGNLEGDPWTDVGTFMENGPLTAIEISSENVIFGLRARYNTILLLVSTWILQLTVCIWVARIVEKVFLGSDNGLCTQK